jgi:putative Mg2+ transporter-C (MgtC) family protein
MPTVQTADAVVAISHWEELFRLFLILVISWPIGFERDTQHKAAGLRTYGIVGVISTLLTLVSIKVPQLSLAAHGSDPARIATGLLQGIGFIGAGVIMRAEKEKGGKRVEGITTAATIFGVCGLGIAVGMGFYFEALVTAGLVGFDLIVLTKVRDWVYKKFPKLAPTSNGDGLAAQKRDSTTDK